MRSLVVLALTLAPAAALAQQQPAAASSTCDVQIDSSHGQSRYIKAPNGAYDTFAGGGIWAHCLNQPATRMYSDSVAWYPDRDLLYLVGNVHFRDSVTILNADLATYYLHQERLVAQGHVYTQNQHTRSDLRGNNLDYYRAAPPLRDTLELFAQQRPTIHFYPSGQQAQSDTEPFVVVADRTHMRGSDEMWGGGNVTIDRSDLAARGDSAELDLGHNAASLLGSPVVNGTGADAYHLRGDRLNFGLTPQHEIRRVLASGHAASSGADWRLDADTLDLTLDSGKVQRAQAWGRGHRPHAVSGMHTIVADSLDIHMPGQLVRLVWAWHTARMVTLDTLAVRATRRDTLAAGRARPAGDTLVTASAIRDSLRRAKVGRVAVASAAAADARRRDAAAGAVPDALRRDSLARRAAAVDSAAKGALASDTATRTPLVGDEDWLLGDSLRADFAVRRDSGGAKPTSELEHLTSYGSARALYHVEASDSTRAAGRRGVNYSRGLRIDIATRGSKVETVDVVGQADGLYLEPLPPARDTSRAAADSAHQAADTLPPAPARTPTPPGTADGATRPAGDARARTVLGPEAARPARP